MKPHTILLVDDDADDRDVLLDAFEVAYKEAHYIALENGELLAQYLAEKDNSSLPSLIVLDLNMPKKDGRETLKEIKSNPVLQQIPIIVFTTSSSLRDRQMVYDLGANCFITKPDTFRKLVELTKSITALWLTD